MKPALKGYLITFLAIIIVPYIMTIFINGKCKSTSEELNRISTGRDVIMYSDGKNYLIDVEQYIAGVLKLLEGIALDYNQEKEQTHE